jgi:hypothetical protein
MIPEKGESSINQSTRIISRVEAALMEWGLIPGRKLELIAIREEIGILPIGQATPHNTAHHVSHTTVGQE